MASTALVAIGLQNDFVLPKGALPVPGAPYLIPIVNSLRAKFHSVVFAIDSHPPDHVSFAASHAGRAVGDFVEAAGYRQLLLPPHCVVDTPGASLDSGLTVQPKDIVVRMGTTARIDSHSCFFDVLRTYETNCHRDLQDRRITALYFCGLATEYCVKFSVLDALELGYSVFVVEDGITGFDSELGAQAIAEMLSRGVTFANSGRILSRPSLSALPPLDGAGSRPVTPTRAPSSLRSIYEESRALQRPISALSAETAAQAQTLQEVSQAVASISFQTADFTKVRAAVESLRDRLKSAQELNGRLEAELARPFVPESDVNELQSPQIEELKNRLKHQEGDIGERERLIRTFKSQLHEIDRQYKRVNAKRIVFDDRRSELLGELERLKSLRAAFDAKQESNRLQIAEITKNCERDLNLLSEELVRIEDEKSQAVERQAVLEAGIAEHKEAIAQSVALVAELEARPTPPLPDLRLLGVDLEARSEKRAANRARIRELFREIDQAATDIVDYKTQKKWLEGSLAEEVAKIEAGEVTDTGNDSPFEKLQLELAKLDEEIEHRELRIPYLRKQLPLCGIKPESVEGEEKDIVEEEDESDFTADELAARVGKLRAARNAARVELARAKEAKAQTEKRLELRKKQLQEVDGLIRTGTSQRLLLGNRAWSEFVDGGT
jgi:nicotinamidase/pyrazinamidase